jgi:hypothetical protein
MGRASPPPLWEVAVTATIGDTTVDVIALADDYKVDAAVYAR